jgi:predicted Zn-dependent peptidase
LEQFVKYKKTQLSNGVVVVTENHPMSRAVCAGIFVNIGTRDEQRKHCGITHFVEHAVFKGTRSRTAFQLARVMEAVGGDLNAYTTREYTCFHTTSLKEHLELSLDVLTDLVACAEFPIKEFPKEKQVILQEIAMCDDNPEEVVWDIFNESVYGSHSLGWPILGTEGSVNAITRSDLVDFYKNYFTGHNIVVSLSGAVDHNEAVDLIEKVLVKKSANSKKRSKKKNTSERKPPRFHSFTELKKRETEQAHIVIGYPGPSFKSKNRFEAFVVNALLGGGMTSKLYQSIREKKGLAYSVYSQLITYTDTGLLTVYAGCDPKNAKVLIETVFEEMDRLVSKKVSERDLNFFRTQVRGSILLGADDVENRMSSLGINEMIFQNYRSVDAVIAEIESVTVDSVKKYIADAFKSTKPAIVSLGSFDRNFENWFETL